MWTLWSSCTTRILEQFLHHLVDSIQSIEENAIKRAKIALTFYAPVDVHYQPHAMTCCLPTVVSLRCAHYHQHLHCY